MKIADVQPELVRLVLDMAKKYWPKGYKVSDEPQDNYASMLREYMSTKKITVWSGASNSSIFGAPELNWAFRAWHDYWHIKMNADFTYENEIRVMRRQQLDVLQWCRFHDISKEKTEFLQLLLEAEIKGQADWQAKYGVFPADQIKFTEEYIRRRQLEKNPERTSNKNVLRPRHG